MNANSSKDELLVFSIAARPEDDDIDRNILGCCQDKFHIRADRSRGNMQMILRVESKRRIRSIATRILESERSL